MNQNEVLISTFTASLQACIHHFSITHNISKNELLDSAEGAVLMDILKQNGANVLTVHDFNLIKKSVKELDVSDNVKIILDQFVDSIEELMRGES